jgi:hypothetical protein
MSEKILAALRQLDPANDNHWTAEGQPRIDTVKFMTGDSTLTREAITTALPGFVRARAAEMLPPEAAAPAPSAPAAPPAPTPAPSPAPEPAQAPQEPAKAPEQAVTGEAHGSQEDTSVGNAEKLAVQESFEALFGPPQNLQEAQRRLDALLAEQADLAREVAEAQATVDRFIEAESKAVGGNSFPAALSGYLEGQQAIRDMRAARLEAMKGVRLSEFLPSKAKIDEAFQVRRGRGNKRPTQL